MATILGKHGLADGGTLTGGVNGRAPRRFRPDSSRLVPAGPVHASVTRRSPMHSWFVRGARGISRDRGPGISGLWHGLNGPSKTWAAALRSSGVPISTRRTPRQPHRLDHVLLARNPARSSPRNPREHACAGYFQGCRSSAGGIFFFGLSSSGSRRNQMFSWTEVALTPKGAPSRLKRGALIRFQAVPFPADDERLIWRHALLAAAGSRVAPMGNTRWH